jgi:hypothetical protein
MPGGRAQGGLLNFRLTLLNQDFTVTGLYTLFYYHIHYIRVLTRYTNVRPVCRTAGQLVTAMLQKRSLLI